MTFEEFDTVELLHDIEEHGLTKGDIGAIVNFYENGKAYEVEFVAPNGSTKALLTLKTNDIRKYVDPAISSVYFWHHIPISLGTISGLTTASVHEEVGTYVAIKNINAKTGSNQTNKDFKFATL